MMNQDDNRADAEQLYMRQLGELSSAQAQPLQMFEDAARTGVEIDLQVERVRWLMQREPMLESRELRIEN